MNDARLEVLQHLPALYAARDFDALTAAAFRLLHATVQCDHVSVFYRSGGTHLMLERDSIGRTFGPEFTQRHAELTPAIRLGLANPGVKLIPTRTGLPLTDVELRETDFYREIMQVQGWRHAVAVCIWDPKAMQFPLLVFSVKRQEGVSDFTDTDLAALETAHGYIEVAVLRLHEDVGTQALHDALAARLWHDRRAVAVANWRFEVVRSNPEARRILNAEPELETTLIQVCQQLDALRLRLVRENPARRILRRRCEVSLLGHDRYLVTVTMMCRDREAVAKPSFVIQIEDGPVKPAAAGEFLDLPADLTSSEQQVALAVAEGLSNQEIADRLSKSLASVKFLLHRIYVKTGAASRTALVNLMRPSPATRLTSDDK